MFAVILQNVGIRSWC